METVWDHLDVLADPTDAEREEPTSPKLARGLAYARGQREREREIDRLNGLSARQLRKLGLTRDKILLHVYRDRLG